MMHTSHPSSQKVLAAALSVKLNGKPVSALVDSGAGLTVIDIEAVRDLGLEAQLITKEGNIFGLAKEPVEVIGMLKLSLDLGNGQNHSFEVLTGSQNTCILGRDLLTKFVVTEFNWQSHSIGDMWKYSQFTIVGGAP